MPLKNQDNKIIYLSICSSLSKYVKIFEKNYLIIRDIAIVSELRMEFGKKTVFILCKFINHTTFFEIKNVTLYDEPSFFLLNFLCKNLFFLCDEHYKPFFYFKQRNKFIK